MKKLLLCGLLVVNALNYGSPRCLEHKTSKHKSPLRKSPLTIAECTCPCQQYPRSNHADGYKCLICDHRLLPSRIQSSNQQAPDNLTPVSDAFLASALIASSQLLYNESTQPKPIKLQKETKDDDWMSL